MELKKYSGNLARASALAYATKEKCEGQDSAESSISLLVLNVDKNTHTNGDSEVKMTNNNTPYLKNLPDKLNNRRKKGTIFLSPSG